MDKIGNRDGCQETDDGNDDHDFNQCEAPFAGLVDFHNLLFFDLSACKLNKAAGGYFLLVQLIVH